VPTAIGGYFASVLTGALPRSAGCPGVRSAVQVDPEAGGVVVMPDDLERLAGLIQIKNEADAAIADLIGRPAAPGNIGEFVAASVFAIRLMPSAAHPGYDGVFSEGPLAGKTVNVKTCSRHESVLDISPHPSDCYLVLTGPAGQARVLPWVIDSVFLFQQRATAGHAHHPRCQDRHRYQRAETGLASRTDLPAAAGVPAAAVQRPDRPP
jgi:hypothetical protein